jgi:hypothetical protein
MTNSGGCTCAIGRWRWPIAVVVFDVVGGDDGLQLWWFLLFGFDGDGQSQQLFLVGDFEGDG